MDDWTVFESPDALAAAASDRIARSARDAIGSRGRAVIAVAGGRSLRPVLQRLALAEGVDWSRVFLTWCDERCVVPADPESNFGQAREDLVGRVPLLHEHVIRVPGELRPIDAADTYDVALRRLLGTTGRLDVVVLGLGADGHVASLFPNHQALREDRRWAIPVHVPADPPWRVTMTVPILRAARACMLVASGREKAPAVARCRTGDDLPATHIATNDNLCEWLIEASAWRAHAA